MSALADALRALMPFADRPVSGNQHAARNVLRKVAPCEACDGLCRRVEATHAWGSGNGPATCPTCSGAGWTPASVEAAIVRAVAVESFFELALAKARSDAERGNDHEEFHRVAEQLRSGQ